jgi:hypothetical protein
MLYTMGKISRIVSKQPILRETPIIAVIRRVGIIIR